MRYISPKAPIMRLCSSHTFIFLCLIYTSLFLLVSGQDDPDQPQSDNAEFENAFAGNDSALPEIPKSIKVTNNGLLQFDTEQGTYLFTGDVQVEGDNGLKLNSQRVLVNAVTEQATLTGDVSVLQNSTQNQDGSITPGTHLFANHVILDTKKKIVTLSGNVSIYQGEQLHRGDYAVYDYSKKTVDTQGLASKLGPILLESDRFQLIERNGQKVYVGDDAGITTHDVSTPHFWIRSDRTTIYPDEKVVFKNLRLFAGDQPVFWLPYLSQPLDANLGYHFIPGVRSNWGFYLLNTYGVLLGGEVDELTGEREGAWLLSRWHFDFRSRRGAGTGVDFFDTRIKESDHFGWLKTYYLNDRNPSLEGSSEERGTVNEDRWKFELKHRIDLQETNSSRTYLEFDITALSDRLFLEDFEPGNFRENPNPDNEIGIFHRNPDALIGLYTRLRLNDFFQTDTRLPELFIDQIKKPIWGTSLLHEGQTSLGIYRERLADFFEDDLEETVASLPVGNARRDATIEQLANRGFSRFHTYHELSLPLSYKGKIAIVPHAGLGHTRYWDLEEGQGSFSRTHISAGVDLSMKFSKLYPDTVHKAWGLNGLLHIAQPYVNFSHLATDDLDGTFRGIEILTSSTRPRPLEVGRFTAIDDLSDWSIARFGIRNRLLTKRDNSTLEWLSINTYLDVFLNDPEFNRNFSNLYNDIIWSPLPWLQLNLETQFSVLSDSSDFTESSGNIRFLPTDSLEFTVGYRKLDDHPILRDSERINFRAYTRLNEAWGIDFFQRWELEDNTLELQQVTLHHNFDSWTASLGLLTRDNRTDDREYSVLLNFSLKDFPRARVPFPVDYE